MEILEPEDLTLEEGVYLVRKARESVEKAFVNEEPDLSDTPSKLWKKGAAFVTINTLTGEKKELRGCIGFVKAVEPLIKTVVVVAREAAFNDPRFPPLSIKELPSAVFEVSVLSSMREMPADPDKRLSLIKIGRTGLMVVRGPFSGLLLPQVPVEEGWDEKTFLDYTCWKAGLPAGCWRDPDTKVLYFIARIFEEEYPGGPIREREF